MLQILLLKSYCPICFFTFLICYCSANLLFENIPNEVPSSNQQLQEFVLNPEKLDILLHTAAIITFLKAKAKSIWIEEPQLATVDKIVFDQCAAEAKSAVSLAKCVVHLLKSRDALKEEKKKALKEENDWASSKGEIDWVTQFKKWIKPMLKPSKVPDYIWKGDQPYKNDKILNDGLKTTKFSSYYDKKFKRIRKHGLKIAKTGVDHDKYFLKDFISSPTTHKWKIRRQKRRSYWRKSTRWLSFKESRRKKNGLNNFFDPFKSSFPKQKFSHYYQNNMLFPMLSSYNNHNFSNISQPKQNRTKRRAVNLNHVFQNFFQPNVNQLRRRRKHRQQRNENFNFAKNWPGASKSAMRRGMSPNLPWFMEPIMQTVGEAKKMLLGGFLGGLAGQKSVKIGRRKRSLSGIKKISYDLEKRRLGDQGKQNGRKTGIIEIKDTENQPAPLNNIEKLRKIQKFYQMVDYCNKYMKELGDSNSRYLSTFNAGHTFEMKMPEKNFLVEELEACLKDFTFENFPILSPQLFSLFPNKDTKTDDGQWKPSFLSPNLLSFHEEGVFSLPTLFGLVSSNEKDMLTLLDVFMDMAGASRILDKLLAEIEPKAVELELTLYPTILRLEEFNKRWSSVRSTLKPQQKRRLQQHDYAILDQKQLRNLYGDKAGGKRGYTLSDMDQNLEEDIYRIAELSDNESSIETAYNILDHKGRTKRDALSKNDSLDTALAQLNGTDNSLLQPPAFGNKLRDGISFAQVVLSPRAFTNTLLTPGFMVASVLSPVAFAPAILSPRAMVATILSPTAFTANILTPVTLFGDVLSPKFFHANILSPRALSALVLSPRFLLFEVLSPKLIELKVLNPNTFTVSILGPNILSPRVLSPVNFGISVLSPNIWSPTVLSKGNFTVQVLSPAIMSGEIDFSKGLNQTQKTNVTMI